MYLLLQCILLILGFAMLVKGADWFVEGSAGIADRFGIPQLVIGLTIVAMGTSAPEAAVSITAALKGSAAITIGNVVGSNILNVLIILGITACIIPVAVSRSTVRAELPYMILITGLLLGLGYTGEKIVLWEGIVLWLAFLLYLGYLFVMAKKNRAEPTETYGDAPLWKLLLFAAAGLGLVIWGSDVTVDAATALDAEVRLYDNLFSDAAPDAGGKNFLDCLNPDSLEVLTDCKLEASLAGAQSPASFQFMRQGYFCVDNRDSTPEHLVFNRSVSLKDSFNKGAK